MSKNNLTARVLSDTFKSLSWMGISKVISQLFTWSVTIYVARILTPTDYGLMGMAGLLIAFFFMFNDLGLAQAIIQADNVTEEALSSVFWFILGISFVFYALTWLLAPFIASFYRNPALVQLIVVMGINFIIGGVRTVPINLLAKEMRFSQKARIDLIATITASSQSLLLVTLGMGVWTLIFGAITVQLMTTTLAYVYYPWKPKFHMRFAEIKSLLNFGWKITASTLLWYFYRNSDLMIIGRLLGERVTGIYSMAFYLSKLPVSKISGTLNQVFYPALSRLKNNEDEFKQYLLMMTKLISNISIPIFIFLTINADSIFNLFLTEKWVEAILPFQILCFVGCLRSVMVLFPHVLNAKNVPEKNLIYNGICTLFLPLGFIFGASYGIKGIAGAWAILYPLCSIYLLRQTSKQIGMTLVSFAAEFDAQFFLAIAHFAGQMIFSFLYFDYFSSRFVYLIFQSLIAVTTQLLFISRLYPGFISNPLRFLKEVTLTSYS